MNDNNAHDEGLSHTHGRYVISDRDLDQLAEATLAWERWERTSQWWATGNLDDAGACDAA